MTSLHDRIKSVCRRHRLSARQLSKALESIEHKLPATQHNGIASYPVVQVTDSLEIININPSGRVMFGLGEATAINSFRLYDIKIDRSFIRELGSQKRAKEIIKGTGSGSLK